MYSANIGRSRPIEESSIGRDRGIWEQLLAQLVNEPDFEWLIIDASHVKVHHHGTGAQGGNQAMARTKGGSIPRCTAAVDAHGMPLRVIITEGTRADCSVAATLIEGMSAEMLLADKAYDTNSILALAQDKSITPVK